MDHVAKAPLATLGVVKGPLAAGLAGGADVAKVALASLDVLKVPLAASWPAEGVARVPFATLNVPKVALATLATPPNAQP